MLLNLCFLDDGGIYKGRLNHRDRAREIDETRDTKVDLPIDYRDAETVEEENLYGNTGVCIDIELESEYSYCLSLQ